MNRTFYLILFFFLPMKMIAIPQPIDSIPFELGSDNRIYIKCRVNDSDTLRFLFDTGASDMVINPNSPKSHFDMTFAGTVENTGATGTNEVKISHGNRFTIGHQTLENMSFISIPYPPDMWDGVIGLSFIRHQVTFIDYQKMKIYLYESENFQVPDHYETFSVEYEFNVPIITMSATINGKKHALKLEVDTGSDRVIDLNTPFVKQHKLLGTQPHFATSQIVSSDGQIGFLYNVYFDNVYVGKYLLPRIPGAFSTVTEGIQSRKEIDGVIGNNFLKRFNMICDFEKNRIYLAPNDQLYTPFYSFLVK